MRPTVNGNEPPPWANAIRSRGDCSDEEPGHLVPVHGLRPVPDHHRPGRRHLHPPPGRVALLAPPGRAPAVLLDLAEAPAVDHHPGAARRLVGQLDEPAVAE